jgi:hypothetical protein
MENDGQKRAKPQDPLNLGLHCRAVGAMMAPWVKGSLPDPISDYQNSESLRVKGDTANMSFKKDRKSPGFVGLHPQALGAKETKS